MAIRGAKLTLGGGKKMWEYKSSRGSNKPIRKTNKKGGDLFFFLETVSILYFVGAPFEFNGRAPFKLVTPLLISFYKCSFFDIEIKKTLTKICTNEFYPPYRSHFSK